MGISFSIKRILTTYNFDKLGNVNKFANSWSDMRFPVNDLFIVIVAYLLLVYYQSNTGYVKNKDKFIRFISYRNLTDI